MPKNITQNVVSKKMRGSDLTFYSQTHHESKFYLGFELELDNENADSSDRSHLHQRALTLLNRNGLFGIDMHRDGSLSNNGIELVGMPATLGAIKQSASAFMSFFEYTASLGYNLGRYGRRAGFHIHLSRRALGKTKQKQAEVISNIATFMWDNRNDLEKFCGRDASNSWATYSDDPWADRDRYQALNVWTDKSDGYQDVKEGKTIEFRMFSGVGTFTRFMAYLELINRIASVATDASKRIHTMTLGDLLGANDYAKAMRTNPYAYTWYKASF